MLRAVLLSWTLQDDSPNAQATLGVRVACQIDQSEMLQTADLPGYMQGYFLRLYDMSTILPGSMQTMLSSTCPLYPAKAITTASPCSDASREGCCRPSTHPVPKHSGLLLWRWRALKSYTQSMSLKPMRLMNRTQSLDALSGSCLCSLRLGCKGY